MSGPRPFTVVLAGRPNVGKSALFNRLVGRRRSLVHDLPGMTRDVLEADAVLPDGRTFRAVDTGGYDPEGAEPIPREVRRRALDALSGADLIVLVMDASAGVLPPDREAARAARQTGVETIVAANKIDRRAGSEGESEAWELGFPEVFGVSAEHGTGVAELVDAIAARIPARTGSPPTGSEAGRPREIALAVVGRPNVGKSSLVNAMLGHERAIVSSVPGTTRDSVDTSFEHEGRTIRLIDTAGIRRKGRTERGPEVLSVVQARKRIADCDVALVVVDAAEGPSAQDATVASYVAEEGKGLVLVANKWDLAGRKGEAAAKELRASIQERMPFAAWAPVLLTSAASGRGVSRILPAVFRVAENRRRRLPTGELNRVLGRALRDKPPRAASGKRIKVFYVAQTGTAPPTLTLVASRAGALHFSEERRVENLVRQAGDFEGTPVRVVVKERSGRKTDR